MLPDAISLGQVGLAVADLDRSRRFWERGLGLEPLEHSAGRAMLGAGERPVLELIEAPGAGRDGSAAGLFHVAFLLPDRAALGHALRRLTGSAIRLTGASDHHVSEALYLDDPDGHGIEIYADRPREAWVEYGRLRIDTMPMHLEEVLAAGAAVPDGPILPPGTTIGHVHLESHDLAAAHAWYTGNLGLEVMARMPQASFLSKGGYHHHLGVNSWGRRTRQLERRADRIALRYWTVVADLPPGIAMAGRDLDDVPVLLDPSGVPLRLTPP